MSPLLNLAKCISGKPKVKTQVQPNHIWGTSTSG